MEPRKSGRPRKQFCVRGHNLDDPANVRIYGKGQRQCRACMRIIRLRWYHAQRAQSAFVPAAE